MSSSISGSSAMVDAVRLDCLPLVLALLVSIMLRYLFHLKDY